VWTVCVDKMLPLCSYSTKVEWQMISKIHFLLRYTSPIPVANQTTVSFKKTYIWMYIFLFHLRSNQRGLCAFLIILILLYESLLLFAHRMFLRNCSSNEMNKMPPNFLLLYTMDFNIKINCLLMILIEYYCPPGCNAMWSRSSEPECIASHPRR
jgi:hypothetical protein